ncbi:hypothetical protein SAMN06295967_111158 [Belliella buryatensis]|uniref:Oxygen tolerance n=1 Tax=Belliella buryatensis TaxID=1500549 RepID=A0A239F746_9BACT|nr:hypothetical protein [Belliella buryatensis]SNS52870.1 hypothetical protein SAMN06295967_111158 [Belliella buryatensis]
MAKIYKFLFFIALLFSFQLSHGQELKVEGYFMQDSAKIGEKVPYVLKAKYSKGMNVVFPDSTFDFSPFVLLEKQTFMSSTKEGITLDSAIYYVSNFSLDPVSNFSLPVFEVMKYDSLEYYPEEASLTLKLLIDPLPEQLLFKDNNIYQILPKSFNYPLLIAVIVCLIIIILVLFFFFGDAIKKQFQTWSEKRKYKRFITKWEKAEKTFASRPDMDGADELLGLWKTYMEHLKNRPFREWTTIEISEFLENKEIIKDFREIEMIIYAGKKGQDISQACRNLKGICAETYQQKITQKHERK